MRFDDLAEFVKCYAPAHRHKREATWGETKNAEGCWRRFTYEESTARDKTSLDRFWLKDKSPVDLENLPEPDDRRGNHRESRSWSDSFRQVAGLGAARA